MEKSKKTVTFASNALTRPRGGGASASAGGRYNVKTRRLTLPSDWTSKTADVLTDNGLLGIWAAGTAGAYAVHPTQRFITLPVGAVKTTTNVTLKRADVPSNWDVPAGTLVYTLPNGGAEK